MKPYWPTIFYLVMTFIFIAWLFDFYRLPTLSDVWTKYTGLYLQVKAGQDITAELNMAIQKIEDFPWWRSRVILIPPGEFIVSGPVDGPIRGSMNFSERTIVRQRWEKIE